MELVSFESVESWVKYLKKQPRHLPCDFILTYITENFNAIIFNAELVDITVVHPSQLLLFQVGLEWTTTTEVTPGPLMQPCPGPAKRTA